MNGVVTKNLLKSKSGEFDLESIHTVCLIEHDLSDLGCIGECSSLERLDLSYNSFTKLLRLAGLEKLQYLNLAANRITSLEGLQALDNLETLNISGNLIGGVEVLRCLTGLSKLRSLRLRDNTLGLSNPVCMNNTYVADVCAMFPDLLTLDGERVSGRGSEVFKMFKHIEDGLAARSDDVGSRNYSVESWVPDNFWEPSRKFEESIMGDAQQQLEDLLSSCTRLSNTADEKLNQLKSPS
ncbi:leucine-rich repeat-containing protein 61-like [Mya arenaria]|uniref:leucine-rich repeat-containing protein 61-like n=1 Tax=Mya arenaria TaxID=6604 RepID=UPI0022E5800B|nr:leucine-rich repeat-containing protein 61-like [Mya arenaria]